MSEAKSKGRPTFAKTDTVQVAGESSAAIQGAAAGETTAPRSTGRPVKDVVVTVRMTADDAEALAFIQAELGSASGPDAVREAIRNVSAIMRDQTYRSDRPQRATVMADRALLNDIRAALDDVTKAYNERAREVHYVGHNWNQIAKVANATGTVDADALRSVEMALISIRSQMAHDAQRDAKVLRAVQCLL